MILRCWEWVVTSFAVPIESSCVGGAPIRKPERVKMYAYRTWDYIPLCNHVSRNKWMSIVGWTMATKIYADSVGGPTIAKL